MPYAWYIENPPGAPSLCNLDKLGLKGNMNYHQIGRPAKSIRSSMIINVFIYPINIKIAKGL